MQDFSYHTHTNFSDGKNSAEEMLKQAVKVGYKKIGISDHLIIHKNIKSLNSIYDISNRYNKLLFDDFDMALKVVKNNISYIKSIAKNYNIDVLVGFEVDFFCYDGWLKQFKNMIKNSGADYLIFGNHYFSLDDEIIDIGYLNIHQERGLSKDLIMKSYFNNIVKAIESNMFDFVAHLDYCKKHNITLKNYEDEFTNILNAFNKTKTPYEISTKGLRVVGDFYPAKWIIEKLQAMNVAIVISDDAHHLSELKFDFEKAENLLKNLKYQNRLKEIGTAKYKRCI